MSEEISSRSIEQNKALLLPALQSLIGPEKGRLLELGRGSTAHAAYFAAAFPHLRWVLADSRPGVAIPNWPHDPKVPNLYGGYQLVPGLDDLPATKAYDYVLLADVLEHVSWKSAKSLFKRLSKRLRQDTLVMMYGPFKVQGQFRSEQDEAFDLALKAVNPQAGIRHAEEICVAMDKGGFVPFKDFQISADQWLLVFKRQPHR